MRRTCAFIFSVPTFTVVTLRKSNAAIFNFASTTDDDIFGIYTEI